MLCHCVPMHGIRHHLHLLTIRQKRVTVDWCAVSMPVDAGTVHLSAKSANRAVTSGARQAERHHAARVGAGQRRPRPASGPRTDSFALTQQRYCVETGQVNALVLVWLELLRQVSKDNGVTVKRRLTFSAFSQASLEADRRLVVRSHVTPGMVSISFAAL